MITLKNDKITLKINELGAEIKSFYAFDREYIWEGRKEVWENSAPLLFPICGGLKEDKYVFEGKEYTLPKHGYTRNTLFEAEKVSDTEAVFLHKSNEETKKAFPFDYELRVIYTLNDLSVNVKYSVLNKSDKTMYFSIGAHEGYYTPDGIENYDVIFQEEETLGANKLCGNLLTDDTDIVLKESMVLPLYDKYFATDALVFKNIKSRTATLRNRITGRGVKVDYGFAKYFLIWHKYASPFICLEPWAGIPDMLGSSYDITEKEGIIPLDADKEYIGEHTLTIF